MGTLTGSIAVLTGTETFSLVSPVQTDWIEFAQTLTYNRKSGGGSTISSPTLLGTGGTISGFGFGLGYTWTSGTPVASGTAVREGIGVDHTTAIVGQGLRFTMPADMTSRTAVIYWGTYSGAGRLTATLLDGSAQPFIQNEPATSPGGQSTYYSSTLTYNANSPNQRLQIDLTLTQIGLDSDGNVWIGAVKYLNGTASKIPRVRRILTISS
jgi:hypothetical protein